MFTSDKHDIYQAHLVGKRPLGFSQNRAAKGLARLHRLVFAFAIEKATGMASPKSSFAVTHKNLIEEINFKNNLKKKQQKTTTTDPSEIERTYSIRKQQIRFYCLFCLI